MTEYENRIHTTILAGIYVQTRLVEFDPYRHILHYGWLIKDMISRSIPIAHYYIKEYWLDIGRIDDTKTQRFIKNACPGIDGKVNFK